MSRHLFTLARIACAAYRVTLTAAYRAETRERAMAEAAQELPGFLSKHGKFKRMILEARP